MNFFRALLLGIIVVCGLQLNAMQSIDPTQGEMYTETASDSLIPIPLLHTNVDMNITGFIVEATVTQVFHNHLEELIEAIYVFPLPHNAAVNQMTIQIGDRTIQGKIKPRDVARRIYEQAKKSGKTAGLLDQERPNIFTQSLANILPNDTIYVRITYLDVLNYQDKMYKLHFPMVVGPRYIPGTPKKEQQLDRGWALDTDVVPDASRITPPVLPPGYRTGHDISLTIDLDAGFPVNQITSISHPILVDTLAQHNFRITLRDTSVIPNKDFTLAYQVAVDQTTSTLFTHKQGDTGYFLFILQPKFSITPKEILPKEVIFVIDNSGSMKGEPIAKTKEAMRYALEQLYPTDLFRLIHFSNAPHSMSAYSIPADEKNIAKGQHYLNQLYGEGGTELLKGLKMALETPVSPNYPLRFIVLLTDAYIGNETEIFSKINQLKSHPRIFTIGIGSSTNRYFLERLAELSRGFVEHISLDQNAGHKMKQFFQRIDAPLTTDINIEFGPAIDVFAMFPSRIPDLFAQNPVILVGRYRGEALNLPIRITGTTREQKFIETVNVSFPRSSSSNSALKTIWARRKIKDLLLEEPKPSDTTIKRITDIALEHSVLTNYTSFVAVIDSIRVDSSGVPQKIEVLVPMPAGKNFYGIFGHTTIEMEGSAMQLAKSRTSFIPYDSPPEIIGGMEALRKNLNYPEKAKWSGITGTIILQVFVDALGKPSKLVVLKDTTPTNAQLAEAAKHALKQTSFIPSKQRQRAIGVWLTIPVTFDLPQSASKEVNKCRFHLRNQYWVEEGYYLHDLTEVLLESDQYKMLKSRHPNLRKYIKTLGPNLILKFDGMWYKINGPEN